MQDMHAREATIARLLAHGVTAEEIAQLAADEAAHQTLRLARAHERLADAPAPCTKRSKRSKPSASKPSPASPAVPSPSTTVPVQPAQPAADATPTPAATAPKTRYRVGNWKAYNQGLVQRGSLTVWFDDAAIEQWLANERDGQVGSPTTYADSAIVCALTLKSVYHLTLRQTEGFVGSLMHLMGVQLRVPDYSTLCRRAASVSVALPRQARSEPLHIVVDSTGVKVYGEGEWKVRQHGYTKRRTWRKIHLGVNEASGEIVAQVTTHSRTSDKATLPLLLEQVDRPIKQVSADGGYDYRSCYEAIAAYEAAAVIPPRENAALNEGEGWQERNAHIERIDEIGRAAWKRETDYHRRSLAETTMFRLKTIFGGSLSSRGEEQQKREVAIRCAALNRMTRLGMPDSERVLAS